MGESCPVEIREPILSITIKSGTKRSHHFASFHHVAGLKARLIPIEQLENLFPRPPAPNRIATVPCFDKHASGLLAGFAEPKNRSIANMDPCLAGCAAFADPRVKVIRA